MQSRRQTARRAGKLIGLIVLCGVILLKPGFAFALPAGQCEGLSCSVLFNILTGMCSAAD
ncbi:MAG: hypothetical protein U1A27_03005 [Phycisphaerae bacterium]